MAPKTEKTMPEATPTGGALEQRQPMTIQQAAAKLEERRAPKEPSAEKPAEPEPAKPEQQESRPPAQPEAKVKDEKTQDAPGPDEADVSTPADDAQQPTQALDLAEIAAKLGVEPEKLYDLEFPTKIDGQDGTATIRQALKNYQLEGHLIGKQREFAEERKRFDQEAQQRAQGIAGREKELETALNMAVSLFQGEYANLDWATLEQTDPQRFLLEQNRYNRRLQELQNLHATLNKGEHERVQKLQQQFDTWAKDQAKQLQLKIPEFADVKVATRELAAMNKAAAEEYGFTPEELGNVYDHRHVLVLRDALELRALKKQKAEVVNRVNKAPPLAKPGTAGKPNITPERELRASLSRTHSVDDAVAALVARRQQTRK